MPIKRQDGPKGPIYVRPAYRPEDYTIPAAELKALRAAQAAPWPPEALLDERDGPFANYREVRRFERDERTWLLLASKNRDHCVEVELGLPRRWELRPVAPEEAFRIARAQDATLGVKVVLDGEAPPQ